MDKVIMIKYGELTTKKGNRNFFVNTLYNNIKHKLKNYEVEISKDNSRMYIEFLDKDLNKILDRINKIFGIHEYLVADKVETDESIIKEHSLKMMKENTFSTFKVETKRADKNFPIQSTEFSKIVGGVILKNINNITVDVHNPDVQLNIEIRPKYSYIYTNAYKGLGGYPNGTQPKGILMLSGGIDSPVAGYLSLKRGLKLEALYFEAIPHTSIQARNKVIDLAKKLSVYTDKIKLHVIPFTEIQESIYKNADPTYCITIMRRMMYRIAEQIAKRNKALVICNGESIGQVASQTLTSMSVINEVTNMPIIRPVACLDKLEIIGIANKIDTYETSILPFEDCCTVFVPKHPVINPNLSECIKYEQLFDYKTMIEKAIDNELVINIFEDMKNEFDTLL